MYSLPRGDSRRESCWQLTGVRLFNFFCSHSCFPPRSYCTSAHAGTGAHARRHCTAGSLLSQVWKTKLQQMVVLVPEQRGSTVPSPWSHTHTHTRLHSLCLCLACPFFLSLCVSVMFIKNMIPTESVTVLHSDLQRAAARFTHAPTPYLAV